VYIEEEGSLTAERKLGLDASYLAFTCCTTVRKSAGDEMLQFKAEENSNNFKSLTAMSFILG